MAMFRSLQGSLLAHRPHLGSVAAVDHLSAVPVALLTGFLGAGKSTMLGTLLADPPDAMVVKAVVNDAGQLPFDPTLVASRDHLEVELTNGCGCCEDSGNVAETLARLAQSAPDLIVLEASGLADPLALAQIVEADPGLRLDRIVAVVDAQSVERQLTDPRVGPILQRQVEAAHVLVVSHTDVGSPVWLQRVLGRLAAIAPGRVIVTSTLDEPVAAVLLPGAVRGAALPIDSSSPDHEMVTVTAQQSSSIERVQIDRALRDLSPSIARCKGLLATPEGDVFLQATASGWDLSSGHSCEASPDNRWFGVTVVGTENAAVQAAVIALGCNIGSERRPEAQSSP